MSPQAAADDRDVLDDLGSLGAWWDDLYYLDTCGGGYKATRKQRPYKTVTAPTPGELNRVILADWSSR